MNKLLLNKGIYTKEVIAETAMAFVNLAEIKYCQDDSYHILTFENCRYGVSLTKKEFENYAVNLMVSKNG